MNDAPEGHGRASGKVILFGEHAVVYGVPAIAAGLSRGTVARVRAAPSDQIRIDDQVLSPENELHQALGALRANLQSEPVALDLQLDMPAGAGLGASASMAVATARAINDLRQDADTNATLSEGRLFEAAQDWERVFHGTPSGVDVAAAAQSRPIRFKSGSAPVPMLLNHTLHIAIAQAGPPASTKEMVENVARFQKRNPGQFQKNLDAIASLVDNASLLLASGDLHAVGKLMDLNHILLSGWMLSTAEIERACRLARNSGALGAKLTGAGGGGCVIALGSDPDSVKEILHSWQSEGLLCFDATISGEDQSAPQGSLK